ncbi:MAG TPA: rRNA maturation RNase YbeY [Candidatus Saccharimonadales bacterium]|nr:rRNA maturation RNase YbeY [Candidatus Saccharimonadales bacterium]
MRVSVIRDPCLDPRQRRAAADARLGTLLRACGDRLEVPARAGLCVRLTGDAELRDLNARFLGIDAPTDVLAFPAGERARVGDVAISVERAMHQASDGVAELRLLAVHGLLHCLGHDHALPEPAAAMTSATRMLLPDADVPDLQTDSLARSS